MYKRTPVLPIALALVILLQFISGSGPSVPVVQGESPDPQGQIEELPSLVPESETINLVEEWQDVNGSFSSYNVAAGDVDDDGQMEIVAGVMISLTWQFLQVFNGETHELEAQKEAANLNHRFGAIQIGDVDQDGQTEIVVAVEYLYSGLIQIYDGATLTLEHESFTYPGKGFTAIEIGDIDRDGEVEIVGGQRFFGTSDGPVVVVVFNGGSAQVEWQSYGLGYDHIADVHLSDVDQDRSLEIIASVYGKSAYVFDGSTHEIEVIFPIDAFAVTSADLDGDGTQSILIGRTEEVFEAYNGKTYAHESSYLLGGMLRPACLEVVDLDEDGSLEWFVCTEGKLLVLSNASGNLIWQRQDLGKPLGQYNQIGILQIDADNSPEILVGTQSKLYQFEGPAVDALRYSKMTGSPDRTQPGTLVTYTITMNNQGGVTVPDAQIINSLPAELVYVPDSVSCSNGSVRFEGGAILWDGVLNGFGTTTVTYQAQVDPALHSGLQIINSAQLLAGASSRDVSVRTTIADQFSYLPLIKTKDIVPNYCIDYSDDFSDPTSGWPTWNDGVAEIGYSNGRYIIDGSEFGNLYIVKAPTCKRLNYSVTVNAVGTIYHEGFLGLLFGLADDFSSFYMFVINPSGHQYALYYVNGNVVAQIAGWNDFVGYGGNPVTLKATRDGSRIVLQINDNVLGEWFDDRISGLTNFGLVNFPFTSVFLGGTEAFFDNFKIKSIRNSIPQSQPQYIFEDSEIYSNFPNWTEREFNRLPMK